MSQLSGWSFSKLCDFLKDYGFKLGHCKGSHYYWNGVINGRPVVVQAINSHKEKERQSHRTMDFAVRHSGIKKEYFLEWENSRGKIIHKEIIG
jgi:predicted RNA binding protein YcfA (HicA-like mRNA interferase family)